MLASYRCPTISGMEKLSTQDSNRLLECLHAGPMTAAEISARLHLSASRVSGLVHEMNRRGLIHAPRCTTGPKGNTVNLWALRPALETPP
ncbi:MarR family transcriptional regulator [Acidithiobacillus sp. MC6.1]|nr:MarR family transcriptional regulator [Acidithiobacillus sp. MC6.1]